MTLFSRALCVVLPEPLGDVDLLLTFGTSMEPVLENLIIDGRQSLQTNAFLLMKRIDVLGSQFLVLMYQRGYVLFPFVLSSTSSN